MKQRFCLPFGWDSTTASSLSKQLLQSHVGCRPLQSALHHLSHFTRLGISRKGKPSILR